MIVQIMPSDRTVCNLSDVITQTAGEILQDEKGFCAVCGTDLPLLHQKTDGGEGASQELYVARSVG